MNAKEENLLKRILQALFPDFPKVVSVLLLCVRLFGYGILSHFGLQFLCPYVGC